MEKLGQRKIKLTRSGFTTIPEGTAVSPLLEDRPTRVLHREGPELPGEDGMKQIEAQAIMALIRAPG